MMSKKARITVMLKKAILDPQGQAVKEALAQLGFEGVADVRVGKTIEIAFNGDSKNGKSDLEEMASALLANPVMEDFVVEIDS